MAWKPHLYVRHWPSGSCHWTVKQNYGAWKKLYPEQREMLEKAFAVAGTLDYGLRKRLRAVKEPATVLPQIVESRK